MVICCPFAYHMTVSGLVLICDDSIAGNLARRNAEATLLCQAVMVFRTLVCNSALLHAKHLRPLVFPCPVMYIINLTLTCHLEARPVLTIIMTQDVFRFHSTTLHWRKSYSVRLNYPLYCSVQLQVEEIYLFVL